MAGDTMAKDVYDVLFELSSDCGDCVGDNITQEECVSRAKLRGALVKWAKETDKVVVDSEDWSEDDILDEWYIWFNQRVNKARNLFEVNGIDWDRYDRVTKQDVRDEVSWLFENHSEFGDLVESKITVEAEENGQESESDSGENDSGSGEAEDQEEEDSGGEDQDYSGPYGEVRRVGILGPDNSVDKNKIRGSMLKFAKEVDVIEVDSMEPGEEGAREAFNTWMMDKLGNSWVLFIQKFLDPGDFREISEVMFERNDEYRSLVEEKWEYKPGNSKESGGSDGDGGEKEKSNTNKGNLGYWDDNGDSESFTISKFNSGYNGDSSGSNSSGDSGVDGGGGDPGGEVKRHQSDRFRLQKFRKIKADKDEMYDVDDIRNTIVRENVWTALDKIPTNSVDMVVTSPPYWALRDYDEGEFAPIGGDPDCDHKFNGGECYKCGAWRGQLGHEPDPEMFVDNIVAIFEKIGRILKPSGSVFLNIGDTYAKEDFRGDVRVKQKSMMAIPYRIYIKMMELGWVMRNPIMWVKQILLDDDNVMGAANPTSVADRINHTFEPMWWFANSQDYYADIYAVRRDHKTDVEDIQVDESKFDSDEISEEDHNSITARAAREGYTPSLQHDAGANIPDAWRVPTGKAGDEHPAVFSPRLVERPIKMGSPKWVCDRCGSPYVRDIEDGEHVGWVKTCSCDTEEKNKGVVFEPFCGRGTTPKVAQDLDRDWITTEVSDKYADFAEDYIDGGKEKRLDEFL